MRAAAEGGPTSADHLTWWTMSDVALSGNPGQSGRVPRWRSVRILTCLSVPLLLCLVGCFGASSGTDAATGHFVISTGPAGEDYQAWGSSLATQVDETSSSIDLSVQSSSGSVSNLRRLTIGTADLAVATADALSDGTDTCAQQNAAGAVDEWRVPLRALARIYDDYLQIIVRDSSTVDAVDDLAGHAVAVGQTGSGSALMACRVLEAAGITVQEQPLGLEAGMAALKDHTVDAVFWSGSLPTTTITEAAEQDPVRLLPLGSLAGQLQQRYGSDYRPATVPTGIYGSDQQIGTVASPNILVARADTSSTLVTTVLETIFDRQTQMAAQMPSAGATDRRTAVLTGSLSLHAAAVSYYRDTEL